MVRAPLLLQAFLGTPLASQQLCRDADDATTIQ
jgi:hypothetical protein